MASMTSSIIALEPSPTVQQNEHTVYWRQNARTCVTSLRLSIISFLYTAYAKFNEWLWSKTRPSTVHRSQKYRKWYSLVGVSEWIWANVSK